MKKISSYSGIVIECGPGKILKSIAKSNGINNVISSSSANFDDELKNFL